MGSHNKSSDKEKKPWPTKEVMKQIYEENLWGKGDSDFYSGTGSHDPDIVKPYLEAVTSFLDSFETPLVVCDLGCGDFNVGKNLVNHTKQYIGVDIVPELIERNKTTFKDSRLQFQCLDISKDELPKADCAIIRQVLQHLSNDEIQSIVAKLANYKYVLLTEHIPVFDYAPNKDIISGQGTRLKKESGVNLLSPPFNLKVKAVKELLAEDLTKGRGAMVTVCFRMF